MTELTKDEVRGMIRDEIDWQVEDWAKREPYHRGANRIPQDRLALSGERGLTEAEVDARISITVEDWAQTGNYDDIPASKLRSVKFLTEE